MEYRVFGRSEAPTLMLIPGLGVSYEIFTPLIQLLGERFCVVAVEVDGFILGKQTSFTSIDDQATQIIEYVKRTHSGRLCCAYGLSLGGKVLSRILERNEIEVAHAIMDAAPLLALPRWTVNPLRCLQSLNVWSCYHHTAFWRWVFHSHYFDVLLDECRKVYPYGGGRAVRDGYWSVYTNTLHSIECADLHYWYGTLEGFVARAQVKHLQRLCPEVKVATFKKMNHGQLLIDHPEEVARRIIDMTS